MKKKTKRFKAWAVFVEGEGNIKWEVVSAFCVKDTAQEEKDEWGSYGIKSKLFRCEIIIKS